MSANARLAACCCALLALGALGCHGNIGDPSDRSPGASGPAWEGAGGAGGADDWAEVVAAEDEAMRAKNPELFDAALRYFPGQVPESAPARLSRLTRIQLDSTVRALWPELVTVSAVDAMPRDPLQTNYEYAENLTFNATNFTPYTGWARGIADAAGAAPTNLVSCDATDATCLDTAARALVTRAFRGIATQAQLDRHASFFTDSVSTLGLGPALADLVDLALTSPSFVFRQEVFTDGAGVLLPAERLQHLTYTLADLPPEAVGLTTDAASSAAGYTQALDTALGAAAARDKLLRFFLAWLEVREPEDYTISTEVFPELTPELAAAINEQARSFVARQLARAAPSLRELTQTEDAFVSDALVTVYGGAGSPDAGERIGVFGQPAVLASHSGPTTTRLVKRGVFFTRKVMCMPLGVPPEDVDTTVPTTPGATERQRIESVTAAARCQGCHAYINPFGFMQENYDAIGRWRTLDEGLPIDANIRIDFLDEPAFSTASPVEALTHLTDSLRFQQCFARQLFRFYMGRNELPGDDPLLRQMFFQFADGGAQDLLQMLRLLAGSASFSNRAVTP